MIGIVSIAAKATLLIAGALAFAIIARHRRASVRHGVYAALFVALLLLPLAPTFLPDTAVAIPASAAFPTSVTQQMPDPAAQTPVGRLRSETAETSQSPTFHASSVPWVALTLAAYFAVLALLIGILGTGVWRLHRWSSESVPWVEATAMAAGIAAASGIRRAVLVCLSADVRVPMTFGFRKQTILMPSLADGWSEDEIERAIRHELEHARRDDWAMQMIARVACAVYWPHPMVWVALRRFFLEAERACDDAVIRSADASIYASQLVTLARSIRRGNTAPALAMASPSRLSERIHAILDPKQPRGPQSRAAILLTVSTMVVAVVTFGSVHLVASTPEQSASGRMAASSDGVREGIGGALDEAETYSDAISEEVPGAFADSEYYRDAIVEAAERGDIDVLKFFFFEKGIDIDTAFVGDGSALLIASRANRRRAVEWLLDNDADPNIPSPGDGNALIAAAGEGGVEVMKLLLDRGARIDDEVPGDENALISASAAGRLEAVRLLIDRGANVNARIFADNREWRTPLNMARRGGHEDVAKLLIAAGARE